MILDFSKCQTPEDVERVFAKNRPQLERLKRFRDLLLGEEKTLTVGEPRDEP